MTTPRVRPHPRRPASLLACGYRGCAGYIRSPRCVLLIRAALMRRDNYLKA